MGDTSLDDSLKKLRSWFTKNAADLPWRPKNLHAKRDPYAVWISETMLQQTQVATVHDYFIRWIGHFPDVQTLARASESEILRFWQGLGYYSRARNIHKAAQIIAALGKFPETRKDLEALPGIGAYTAGAILSLAFHKSEAILDGNLVRIFSRMYELDFLPTDKNAGKTVHTKGNGSPHKNASQSKNCAGKQSKSCNEIYWDYAKSWAHHPKGYMHNEALMELGRTVCKAKKPDCNSCPLKAACRAKSDDRIQEFPPAKKHVQKDWHGTALVVESADGKYLAVRGGCPFLAGQLSLPHFESPRNATAGLPSAAERFLDADQVESIRNCGTFRHGITVHKIECEVLHIKLKKRNAGTTAKRNAVSGIEQKNISGGNDDTIVWIPKAKATEAFANSFSLKALKAANR